MKILSYQPFSLYSNSGGSRILRRLYEGRESQVFSLTLSGRSIAGSLGNIPETAIPIFPLHRRWMKWRLRNLNNWLRERTFRPLTERRIRSAYGNIAHDVIHVVNHGPFSSTLTRDSVAAGKPIWASFHDHFSQSGSTFADAEKLWNSAERRLVITSEMGIEYQRIFGHKEYEIITDGVTNEEFSLPVYDKSKPLIIYFAGMVHLEYLPLFNALAEALDLLSEEGLNVKMIMRGTGSIKIFKNRYFEIEYKPVSFDNEELKKELDSASVLYLPMKFTNPDYYLYSLSTKMVGYLGASGTILYHGPGNSAACRLLKQWKSAICCTVLDSESVRAELRATINERNNISNNAKILAKDKFSLSEIKERFWQYPFNKS